jgi:hydroxypyruvate isomerase
MPRFCANLTMLYNELDFLDRFEAAKRAVGSGAARSVSPCPSSPSG